MNSALAPAQQQPASSELAAALGACRRAFVATAVFSGMSNILMLTGALFMLEVYDRILPSRSVPTLVALLVLVGGLYAAQGMIDTIRSRILVRVGHSLDESMSGRVYDAIVRLPLKIGAKGEGTQPIRDLDSVRSFLSGSGPVAFFDLPWMPVYLAICFLFHTFIGLTALLGAFVLVTLTIVTEIKTRHPTRSAAQFAVARNALLEASRRNAEAITAMGMVGRIAKHWHELNRNFVVTSGRASDVGGGLGATSKVLRLLLQSAILAVGAWLVINQQSTPGIIIAGSILGARALAPVDLAIANWRGFVAARQSWQRLSRLLAHLTPKSDPMPLKPPARSLVVQNGAVAPPGVQKVVCQDINFTLAAGKALGVIGPTASGKSSLARMLVGVWRPLRGTVRLDGATLDQWSSEALGPHIGYVPQDVELFNGTVAQNICRFEDPPDPDAVIAAAQAAGVHDLIINLPEGYDTVIGDHGSALSAGQAQRVALARALYRDPFLVVLDEPNSNLDAEGDEALTRAILGLRVTRANLAIVSKGLIELYARKARLAAERDGADVMAVPPELANRQNEPDVKEALGSERKLFELRHQDRLGQKQQLQERITQLKQQIAGLEAQQAAKDKGIALTEQELQGVRDLWQKNLVQLNRLTSLQRDEARLDGERGQIIAQAAEAKGKIAEIQLQIIQVDQDLASDVAKELRETDSKIGEYVERKVTAEDQLKRTDIRAPQDGIVFQSTANTVGGVIAAGDPIMMIVPESDNLTVEVKVDPKDIDQVKFGQSVVLRFSSFNVRTTPEINGTISRIAADTSTDQRTGQSYYLVRIAMPAQELKRLGDVRLTPGMPVEAFIETGERTMMSYLLKPLHDQLMHAFREK